GMIAGTPQYMSPEQACGDAIDARSDLFSLGSVLYFLCTGRPPFRAETSYGVLRKITDSEPRPIREISPAIPDWLAALIKKLHAKQPGDRQGSAEEVTEVLEQCLSHCQQPPVVPLPNAVRLLVVAGENTAAEANQQGGAADASVRKPVVVSSARERRSRIQRIAIGAAVVLIGCAATVNWWHQGLKEEGTRGSSAGQSADAALRGRPEDPAKSTALWDDGAIERIIELQGEIDDVERRGLPLWDPVPDQSLKGE
ncbi:MAG: hypothetical protein EHM42_11225, partial [Planctomycetaceae bacterium]